MGLAAGSTVIRRSVAMPGCIPSLRLYFPRRIVWGFRGFWVVCLLCLIACSRAPEPPRGLAGLAFGDPPPAGVTPAAVPLPSELADALAFFIRPGHVEACSGIVLTAPVLAFYQGRFFSVSADLADAAAATSARENLTRDFGPAYCRDSAGVSVCLWRLGDVDAVLESAGGPVRFMLRYRPVAELLAATKGLGASAVGEGTP
jgi:hypothetical protein